MPYLIMIEKRKKKEKDFLLSLSLFLSSSGSVYLVQKVRVKNKLGLSERELGIKLSREIITYAGQDDLLKKRRQLIGRGKNSLYPYC